MNTFFFTLIVALFAIAFMIVALMITYWRKGYHLESDVGGNRHMKERGLVCTSKAMRDEERELYGLEPDSSTSFCGGACGDCGVECTDADKSENSKGEL